jgi:hypothetical protein
VAAVASSALSDSDASVVSGPRALVAITTVTCMSASELPAAMGVKAVEVHVNTVLAADKAQAQPLGLVVEVEKLSPMGKVTTSVGSL